MKVDYETFCFTISSFLFIWPLNGCSFWCWTLCFLHHMHWMKFMPCYKERIAQMTDLDNKDYSVLQSFIMWRAGAFLFPWFSLILVHSSVFEYFLPFCSSSTPKSFCPACTSSFDLFICMDCLFPNPCLCGPDLYSFLFLSSLAFIPFWIYFRAAKDVKEVLTTVQAPFSPYTSLESWNHINSTDLQVKEGQFSRPFS